MKRCLLWGAGEEFFQYQKIINYMEKLSLLSIVGVTAINSTYDILCGYKYIPLEDLASYEFDLLIITSHRRRYEILDTAIFWGIDENIIIFAETLFLPEFGLDKYLKLKSNCPSIISQNCWGGFTYHRLGLRFKTPFINMLVIEEDCVKLFDRFEYYIKQPLVYNGEGVDPVSKKVIPLARMGDVKLKFNHHDNFEDAVKDFEKRKQRIDFSNLMFVMYTDDKRYLSDFMDLDREKKICFTTRSIVGKGIINVPFELKTKEPLWSIVNAMAFGHYVFYDAIDLLLTGEVKKITEVFE